MFLPRTLHTNSIYNFCTFVLSYFYLYRTHTTFLQRILIHARTFFHFRLAQAPEQSTWLLLSLHRLPAFLLVATLFFSTNKSYFSTSFGLSRCHTSVNFRIYQNTGMPVWGRGGGGGLTLPVSKKCKNEKEIEEERDMYKEREFHRHDV